jgi:hypothetical protein|tara:strand:- start:1896 stop:2279 length:384 start_codon:yes stop_codon:yes gene_type:complete
MSNSPFYRTGKSKSPLHQEKKKSLVNEKRTTRLADKVEKASNSPKMTGDTTSKASKKFDRKNEKFRKKTGLTNWTAETTFSKKNNANSEDPSSYLPKPKPNENKSDYMARTTGNPGFVRSNTILNKQ